MTQATQHQPVQTPEQQPLTLRNEVMTTQTDHQSKRGLGFRKLASTALSVVAGLGAGGVAHNIANTEALAQSTHAQAKQWRSETSSNKFNQAIINCRNDALIDRSPGIYWTHKYPNVRNRKVITPSVSSARVQFTGADHTDPDWINFFGGADKMSSDCGIWGGRDIVLRAVIKNPKTGKWQRNSKDVYAVKGSSEELVEKKVKIELFKPIKCAPGKAKQDWGIFATTSASYSNKPNLQDPTVFSAPKTGKIKELKRAQQMAVMPSQFKRIYPC